MDVTTGTNGRLARQGGALPRFPDQADRHHRRHLHHLDGGPHVLYLTCANAMLWNRFSDSFWVVNPENAVAHRTERAGGDEERFTRPLAEAAAPVALCLCLTKLRPRATMFRCSAIVRL